MDGKERIAEMSKQWLIDALFELMKKENFENITVTEISKTADLSRRTFYRSFKNKMDLLDLYFEKTIDEYLRLLDKEINKLPNNQDFKNISFQDVINIFLDFWWEHRVRTRILINQGLFFSVFVRHTNSWSNVYKSFEMPWHIDEDEDDLNYVADFFIGGYINIISRWLTAKNPKSSKEISDIIYNSVKAM